MNCIMYLNVGRDSSVGIATCYVLDGPGIESRWEARISAPVQTVPGAHSASCTKKHHVLPRGYSGLGMALITQPT